MKKTPTGITYSATDFSNYLECEHLTVLDRLALDEPMERTESDEMGEIMKGRGIALEKEIAKRLKKRHNTFIDISKEGKTLLEKMTATLKAMKEGVEIIYQAALYEGNVGGFADFLRRVEIPSGLGNYSYEVMDAKLAHAGKPKFIIQLVVYSELVAQIQKLQPQRMHLLLGNGLETTYSVSDYIHYFHRLKARFFESIDELDPEATYPNPCHHCGICQWSEICEAKRLKDDHLSQVANISTRQIKRLNAEGIQTMEQLAKLPENKIKVKIQTTTLNRLRDQARLQYQARETGKGIYELVEDQTETLEGLRGFHRLPKPHSGDLFFDMEGNPLEAGGLEYLFGLLYVNGKKETYKHFWAHSREEEKGSFEAFMDFIVDHLAKNPGAHIYHYAAYEQTALKKLMSLHATRGAEVDDLLRRGLLVDLYQVVREAVRVSEPSYSIKNLEHFYMKKRDGEINDGGASIVYYERWKTLKDQKLLTDIEDYNKVDLDSTLKLRNWLLEIGKDHLGGELGQGIPDEGAEEKSEKARLKDERMEAYHQRLISSLPANELDWTDEDRFKELLFHLLGFYSRERKSSTWAVYARRQMSPEERLEDLQCIAGCELIHQDPTPDSRSKTRYTYRFPEQEFKLKSGDELLNVDSLDKYMDVQIDSDKRELLFDISSKKEDIPHCLDAGQSWAFFTGTQEGAVERFVDACIEAMDGGEKCYEAVTALLKRELPKIKGVKTGKPLVDVEPDFDGWMPQIIKTVSQIDHSCLFIQGPPGAGKTYTGSKIILALMKQGKKVGITSNSHKAINNLLNAIEEEAEKTGQIFRGVKKSSEDDGATHHIGVQIKNTSSNDTVFSRIASGDCSLAAGTAWLFANAGMNQQLDYLFVDEAGQVSLANLVAVGTSAKNIVLLGDQMQLSQPIQGVHPGEVGLSSLDYLLQGEATIAPEKGIFLSTSWRMHPDVCRFISDAVYDSRLEPEKRNAQRKLIIEGKADPALAPSGIRFVPVQHEACSQVSEEEAERVLEIYQSLLKMAYTDETGALKPMKKENILVVSPYNMQVDKLTEVLPKGAKVGTVDKFQGQEAEVVIISMATSSGDDLPRNIEFLYSKNRLNVAVSRAKCLAILVANPALLTIPCKTPEQMALVNTLCWVSEKTV